MLLKTFKSRLEGKFARDDIQIILFEYYYKSIEKCLYLILFFLKVREQFYLMIARIICIEFPHSSLLDKILNLYDLNNNYNMEHLFKAIYTIFKSLVKEIHRLKPSLSNDLQNYFEQKAHIFKNLMDLSMIRIQEFGALLEMSQEVNIIENITLYMSENMLKFSLKMLNIETLISQNNKFHADIYLKHLELLQNLGHFYNSAVF